jgi:enoyl-CoA hydratase/carnithine racemase
MARARVTVEKGADRVAVITVDYPPVNTISTEVHNALFRTLSQLHSDQGVKAIVLKRENGKFCGRGGHSKGLISIFKIGISFFWPTEFAFLTA